MDNIRVKEDSLNNWRSGFEIEEGKKKGLDGKACWDGYKLAGTKKKGGKTVDNCVKEDQVDEGAVTTALGIGAALSIPYLAKKFLKPKTDKLLDQGRKTKIGGDTRSGTKTESYNTSDWRNEFHPTEIESIDIIKNEPLVNEGKTTRVRGIKVLGSGHPKNSAAGTNEKPLLDYSKIRASKEEKKETVAASYETDLENLIVEILEGDIQAMYEHGFSYQEIIEFYDVEDEFLEEGLVSGAIAGAKIIAKVAPKVAKYVAKRGAKDIKTVSKFVRNPQNWSRANKDIDKVGKFVKELPARTYQSGKALRGATNKGLLNPAKDVADKLVKSQKIANRAINIKKISAAKVVKTKLPKVDFKSTVPTKSTNVSTTATKALKGTKDKVTKGMTPKEIRSKGMNVLAKMQGKTPKQQKAKELTSRIKNAIDKSKKPTTYSGKVDAAKKLPNPQSAVVKGGSTAVATTKVVAKTTKIPLSKTTVVSSPKANLSKVKSPAKPQTIDVKASPVGKGSKATQSKIAGAKKWMEYNKRASVPSDVVTGNPNPPKFSGGKGSLKPRVTVSKDKLLGKVATGVSGAAGLIAGVKVGQKVAKTDSPTTSPTKKSKAIAPSTNPPTNPKAAIPDEENKTISNTEKKTVDPKKNEVVTKKATPSPQRARRDAAVQSKLYKKGKTKWVGKNTTWTDRYGNVIAPKEVKE